MKNKFNKKIIILVGIAILLCVMAISVAIAVGGNRKDSAAQMLELGARYLSELDYENAIVAYEAAIEIEPMNEDAYLGLAEVYVAMGDIDKALEVLAEGYAKTESVRIAQRQEELEQELVSKPEPTVEPTPEDAVAPTPEPMSYTIKQGDTLIGICIALYGSDERVAEICNFNGITNPDDIKVGQKILLP